MQCDCEICNGRSFNNAGIQLAESEIIPFFKQDLLKLKYPKHPFPMKYDGLLASVYAFGQALAYNRAHNIELAVYYTKNKWLLKYANELSKKFGMPILHESELKTSSKLVCEFNTED